MRNKGIEIGVAAIAQMRIGKQCFADTVTVNIKTLKYASSHSMQQFCPRPTLEVILTYAQSTG